MARQLTAASLHHLSCAAPLTTAPWTLAGWLNPQQVAASWHSIFTLGDSASAGSSWNAYQMGGSSVRFYAQEGGSAYAATTSGLSLNTWSHLAFRESSATDRAVLLDGGSKGTNTTSKVPTGVDTLWFGVEGDNSPSSYGDITLAEWALWDVALTDAEIASLALNISPYEVRPDAIVFHSEMIRGKTSSGGDDIDIVGGLILTDTNGVGVADHPRIIEPDNELWTPFAAAAGGVAMPIFDHHYRSLQAG